MRSGTSGRVGLAILGVAAAVTAVTFAPLPSAPGVARAEGEKSTKAFQVDKVHSSVIFGIKHLGVGYVYGRFNMISGQFLVDPKNAKDSSIDMTIKVESIDTGEDARDKVLRGPDFFNVKVFPTATFKSTAIRNIGDGLEMTGDLTIHGTTKRITVPLEFVGEGADPWGNDRSGIHAEFTIKRSDFGITYMPEGLGDDIRMIVSAEGVRR